jgi:O-antigen ligase
MLLLKQVEKVFVIFSLVFFTGAIGVLMNGGTAPSSLQIDLISRLSSYVIQAGTFCLIFAWHRRIIRTVIQEKFLWFLVAIALASVFWSEETRATLGGSQNLIRITLFGVYFAARYSLKDQLRLLAWAFGIGATLSLVFVLALPSYGVMGQGSIVTGEAITHAGAWQGIYGHKNILGRIMVLSAVVFLIFALSGRRYSWLAWVGFGLSVVLILGSTSKTSLIIFLTIMALLPFYRALRWSNTLAVPFFITVILVAGSVAMLLVSGAEDILGVFGRDITLTGRTDLWAAVLDKIWQRPWLGYGYGAFWRGWDGESADVWSVVRWEAPHSHNGFLDLWLDLGLLGLLAFTLSFIALCLRAVSWVRQTKTAEGLWPLAYLTFLLLANLTESSLLRQNSLWLLYVAVTLSIHNRNDNLVESKVGSQQKVKGGTIKQITPKVQGRRM